MTLLDQEYTEAFPQSGAAHARAMRVLPDGVTHVARGIRPFPVLIDRAAGSRKWTVEGRELIDYVTGHGSLLLGHSYPPVVQAVQTQMARATHPGGSTELEIEWAEWVCRLVPGAEKVRFVNSGTEAAMMAARLARIYTCKSRILRFHGHFHGWSDGLATDAMPPYGAAEPGIDPPPTVTVAPGDLALVEQALSSHQDVAAVILEPTGGHWGEVPLGAGFLQGLREISTRHGVLLICDEVVTGFRVAPGGAQEKFGVQADLTVLAKVLAGGLPGGAVTGRAEILELLAGSKPGPRLRHPGTFNGNPLSAVAGIATLREVSSGDPQRRADAAASALRQGMNRCIQELGLPWRAYGTFSDFHVVTGYEGPQPDDDAFIPYGGNFARLCVTPSGALVEASRKLMLLEGVDWFGMRGITSAAHSEQDIAETLTAFRRMATRLQNDGVTK